MSPAYPILTYYRIMRQSKDKRLMRYEIVRYAKEHGKKPAARAFGTTIKTVRKWVRRWDGRSLESLSDENHAPKNIPHRTPLEVEREVARLKRKLPTWGANRLKRDFNLPCSEKAILRIYRKYGLIKKRKTIRKKKNDLRKVKAKMRLFERVHCDTKHLYDIAEFLEDMGRLRLPRYQYTFRETVSGLQFISFSQELAGVYAELFGERIQRHLAECGIELKEVTWQSDNGSEFVGAWNAKEASGFTKTIERGGSSHRTIPPGAHTYQSDVETVHNTIENEFYCIERFRSRRDFLEKASTYQLFYNTVRPNSSKGNRSPLEILKERSPEIDPRIVLLPPVFLEDLMEMKVSAFRERRLRKTSRGSGLDSKGKHNASGLPQPIIQSGGYDVPSYA